MHLQTEMQAELDNQLPAESDHRVREAIAAQLAPVFSNIAHDIDLWFYLESTDQTAKSHHNGELEKSEAEFEFYLPIDNYRHVALANLRDNEIVAVEDTAASMSSHLSVAGQTDTIGSQRTALYAAWLPIQIEDTIGHKQKEVEMSMVNTAVALVVDTTGCTLHDLKVVLCGTAVGMSLYGGEYMFDKTKVVKADEVSVAAPGLSPHRMPVETAADSVVKQVCYTMVSFPSREETSSWQVKIYATLADGKITENILTPAQPLKPSDLVVIKTKITGEGQVDVVSDREVGATFTLNWNEGGSYDL